MSCPRVLVFDADTGVSEEVELTEADRDLLERQMEHCLAQGDLATFVRWLAQAISASLPTSVAYDVRPPSEAQVGYATAIARELGVALPADVLRRRGPMHDFLSRYSEEFLRRRRDRSKGSGASRDSDTLRDDSQP